MEVMRGSDALLSCGPLRSASATMLRNLMMRNGLPPNPMRSCRKNTGPGEVSFTSVAITSMGTSSSNRATKLKPMSNARLMANCQAGMICGFTSISGAPKMLVIFTLPLRMSYMSGMILMRTLVPSSSFRIRLMCSCSLLSTAMMASST